MKIEHIRIEGFGRLSGFDTGPTSLGRLVVVLGPNEAGKSTLFSFLTTALYGFSPASRELSPHVPWGADEAGGEIGLRLRDGTRPVVSRRLRSSPTGTLVIGDSTQELRNRPLRWVEHVPRTVFRQVFAITLAELAGLDEDTWGSIQERVLGSMGTSDLRPARAVADQLEKEAGEIWRPNRRGNQQLRDLQAEIRALRSRRHEAVERDRRIRHLVEERENVRLRQDDAKSDRLREKVAVDRMQELIPLKRQLDRIDELRRAGGPRGELHDLPTDLAGHRRELVVQSERWSQALRELELEMAAPEAAAAAFTRDDRRLLEHRVSISAFLARADEVEADPGTRATLDAELVEVEARTTRALGHLLREIPTTRDAVSEVLGAVERISLDLLGDRIERLRSSKEAAVPAPTPGPTSGATRSLSLGAVGVGAALATWGVAGGPTLALVSGAAVLAVGLTLAFLGGRSDRSDAAAGHAPRSHSRAEDLEAEIQAMMADVPVDSDFLTPPGAALVAEVRRLQELGRERQEAERRLRDHVERADRLKAEAAELTPRLGPAFVSEASVETTDLFLLVASLRRAVSEADARRNDARSAEAALSRLRRSRASAAEESEGAVRQLEELDARVLALAPTASDVPAAVRLLQTRLDAHARADRLGEELERSHHDLDHRRSQILDAEREGVPWTVDEEELARRKERIEELDRVIEELAAQAQALERDALHLRERETVDSVDSEIESLREEEASLRRERDRKWLLARLIRDADRRFREEHQPDLLRRASEYIEHLTAGRYERLVVDEDRDGDLFQLMGPQLPAPVPLSRPISTGTLEQAYLALRLAIVDHLDHSEERLPLFMDEAFVNWDDERRERGLAVLADVSRSRQVFAFTCHPSMADELARLGACVLRLER